MSEERRGGQTKPREEWGILFILLSQVLNEWRRKKWNEENISDELCVRFQEFRWWRTMGTQATGELPPSAWPVAVTGESRNLIQISAHTSKQA